MSRILTALFISSTLTLSACSDANLPAAQKIAEQNTGGVEVSSAVINPPFSGRTTSAGFMTLENKGEATKLIAASSPISPRVEIHTHIDDNGVMRMRKVDGIPLASGETVELKPGGYHLMMFDTKLPDDQADAPLTLTYEDGTSVTMIVPIEGREGDDMDPSKMDHSGH